MNGCCTTLHYSTLYTDYSLYNYAGCYYYTAYTATGYKCDRYIIIIILLWYVVSQSQLSKHINYYVF